MVERSTCTAVRGCRATSAAAWSAPRSSPAGTCSGARAASRGTGRARGLRNVCVDVPQNRPRARRPTTRVQPMVTVRHSGRLSGGPAGRVVRRRWHVLVRRLRTSPLTPAVLLCLAGVVIGIGQHVEPMVLPLVTLVIPMVVGSLVLGPRLLPWVVVFNLGVVLSVVASTRNLLDSRRGGGGVGVFLIGVVIPGFSFWRGGPRLAPPRGGVLAGGPRG